MFRNDGSAGSRSVSFMRYEDGRYGIFRIDRYSGTTFTGTEWRHSPIPSALQLAAPNVSWDAASRLRADFDCDGRLDLAFLGRADGKVFVGLVRDSAAPPQILQFTVGKNTQDSICAEPAVLSVSSIDFDPTSEIGPLPGFRRSAKCPGMRLSGGECDSIHFYWNHATAKLDWWRL